MSNKKFLAFMFGVFLVCGVMFCHDAETPNQKKLNQLLDSLEKRLEQGDVEALVEVGVLMENRQYMIRNTRYGTLTTKIKRLSIMLLKRYTLFSQFTIHDELDPKEFAVFVNRHKKDIQYIRPLKKFVDMPVEKMPCQYQVRRIPKKFQEQHNSLNILKLYIKDFEKSLDSPFKEIDDGIREIHQKIGLLEDLRNPLVLKYISLLVNHFVSATGRESFRFNWKAQEVIEGLTGVTVEVKDNSGNWTSWLKYDQTAKLNYIIYWNRHFMDYRWDKENQGFTNKVDTILPPNLCDMYFRVLSTGKKSTEAKEAFLALLESDSETVSIKMTQYDSRRWAGFWPGYLERLNQFTNYCRNHSIPYTMIEKLRKKLEQLKALPDGIDKYRKENQMVKELTRIDIPTLEFYVLSHDNYELGLSETIKGLEKSIWRMLNIWYSDHWLEVTQSTRQLRFYLKKSFLFDHIGIVGIHNNYLFKFGNMSPYTRAQLELLIKNEKDQHIKITALNAITGNLDGSPRSKQNQKGKRIALDEFLKNVEIMPDKVVPSIDFKKSCYNYKRIVDLILEEKKPKILSKYIRLLEYNPSLVMVPQLFRIIQVQTVLSTGFMNLHDRQMRDHTTIYEITVSDRVVAMLERLYCYCFPPPPEPEKVYISGTWHSSARLRNKKKTVTQWLELWKKDGKNYSKWGEKLYSKKLHSLEQQSKVDIRDINALFASKFYSIDDRKTLLKALGKVSPQEHINYFEVEKGALEAENLKYFEDFSFHPAKVSDLFNYFSDIDARTVFAFLKKVSNRYTITEKGELYDEFVFNRRFREWLREAKPSRDLRNDIVQGLTEIKKRESNDFIKEEIEALVSFVKRFELPVDQQIEQILAEGGIGVEESIIQVMTDACFQDLGTILSFYPRLPIPAFWKVRLIADDLGFCVSGLNEKSVDDKALELAKNMGRLSEFDLYKYYLDQWGVDYTRKDGTFDLQKIYRILKFDSTSGYFSPQNRYRHVLSIIRLLEFKFKTRLGFEARFNDSINSMRYNTQQRAGAWIKYLLDKGLVVRCENEAPSF